MYSRIAGLMTLALFAAFPARAQQPDTLSQRIERLERMVADLQTQVAEQSKAEEVGGTPGSYIDLSGLILVNGFTNNANAFMDDVPQFVQVGAPPGGLPNAGASAAVRQSQLTITTGLDDVMGATFTGELNVDFFGGQAPSTGGRAFPTLRIRRARADLDWGNLSVMIGQEAPPIAELDPSSLAAVGFPGFSGSGNLWLWLPQVRVRFEVGESIRVGVEGAALAPATGTEQSDLFYTEPDQAERSRRPFAQGRLVASWDKGVTSGELSVGGHYGWYATTTDDYLESRAAAVSLRASVMDLVEIRAEGFVGEGLHGLGGGGIYQTFAVDGSLLQTKGGWAQINLFPLTAIEIGGGYGFDDPEDPDLDRDTARFENTTYEGHIQWKPSPLVFGVEFRRLETKYGNPAIGILSNHHINVAAGFEF